MHPRNQQLTSSNVQTAHLQLTIVACVIQKLVCVTHVIAIWVDHVFLQMNAESNAMVVATGHATGTQLTHNAFKIQKVVWIILRVFKNAMTLYMENVITPIMYAWTVLKEKTQIASI